MEFFIRPLLLLLQLGVLSHWFPELWPSMIWPGCQLFSRQSPPGPHISFWWFFFPIKYLSETCPWIWQVSWPIDIPIIIDAFLLLDIQIRMSSSGYVNVLQWNMEWFLLSVSKIWLWVQRDGGVWSFLTWTKSHLIASPASGNVSRESCGRDPSDSPRKSILLLSLNWSIPYQGGCSQVLISSKGFDSSILRLEKINSPFSLGHITLFSIESFWVDFRCGPSSPTPQGLRPVRHPSKFPSALQMRIQGTIQVRLSFQIDGFLNGPSQLQEWYSNQWTKWNNRSSKWFPKTSFHSASSHHIMESVNVSQIGVTFHRICPPNDIQTWLQLPDLIATTQQKYLPLTLRAALSTIPFVSDLFGVDVQWFQERSSQTLPYYKELSRINVMTLRFLSGLKELLTSFFEFPVKFLFCTDALGSIGWPSPAPCLHIWWLFRDLQLSLRTLWSAVVKSPNISARGAGSAQCVFCAGLLWFWSSGRSRNFGPWGNKYKHCAYTNPRRLLSMGSKGASWEELAWESPCSGITSSAKIFLNSWSPLRDFRACTTWVGKQRVVSVPSWVPFFWAVLDFLGLGQHRVALIVERGELVSGVHTLGLAECAGLPRTLGTGGRR